MKTLNQLMQDIIQLTTEIETKYPELYKYLNETPLSLYENATERVQTTELEQYLETLKSLLQHHIETHLNNK
jgi:predicted Rossmann fold nucleotide-binding protein DprA/Smf involved in DNA uptake